MNLVGEVHAHGQLDEQVDAETVAALRDDGLTWTQTPIHQKKKKNPVWVLRVLPGVSQQDLRTWYGPVGSGTDHLLDQNSVNGVLFFARPVALRRLDVNERLLMDRHDLKTQDRF